MMRKRIALLIMTVLCIAMCAAGCGKKEEPAPEPDVVEEEPAVEEEPEEEIVEEPTTAYPVI